MNAETNPYVTLVERFCTQFFEGQLPALPDDVLAEKIKLTAATLEEWQDQPEAVIEAFKRGITEAVRDVRERLTLARQFAELVSPWTN